MSTKTSSKTPRPNLGGDAYEKSLWTIIILMAAESDLGEDFKNVYDQMARVGSTEGEVNFVVIFDGLNVPGKAKGEGHVTVYHVIRNNFYSDVTDSHKYEKRFSFKFDNLTNRKNLKHILASVKNSFPAEHYGFIYKGHGGPNPDITNASFLKKRVFRKYIKGRFETDESIEARVRRSMPKGKSDGYEFEGIIIGQNPTRRGNRGPDSNNGEETALLALFSSNKRGFTELAYSELAEVLDEVFCLYKAGKRIKQLDFICLDCCWGQLIENGIAFRDVTKYLVASADEMAIMGIGYEGFSNFLINRPDVFPDELADLIVSEYFQVEYNDYLSAPNFNNMGVSLTCIETTYLDDIVMLMSKLSDHLIKNITTHFYIIHLARLQCKAYTYELKESDYKIYNIDLIWFLENLQYYNKVDGEPLDDKLDIMISEILRELSLYYIKSFLASNYEVRKPGENGSRRNGLNGAAGNSKVEKERKKKLHIDPIVGGKGIGIIFPSKREQLLDSLYSSRTKYWLCRNWHWGKFLQEFVQQKRNILSNSKAVRVKILDEQLNAFSKKSTSNYEKYLDWYNDLGNGRKSDSLRQKLNRARTAIKLDIEHKFVVPPLVKNN